MKPPISKLIWLTTIANLWLLIIGNFVFAEDLTATSFILRDSQTTMLAGQATATSTNFQHVSGVQNIATSESTSTSFTGQSGILYFDTPVSSSAGGGGSGGGAVGYAGPGPMITAILTSITSIFSSTTATPTPTKLLAALVGVKRISSLRPTVVKSTQSQGIESIMGRIIGTASPSISSIKGLLRPTRHHRYLLQRAPRQLIVARPERVVINRQVSTLFQRMRTKFLWFIEYRRLIHHRSLL